MQENTLIVFLLKENKQTKMNSKHPDIIKKQLEALVKEYLCKEMDGFTYGGFLRQADSIRRKLEEINGGLKKHYKLKLEQICSYVKRKREYILLRKEVNGLKENYPLNEIKDGDYNKFFWDARDVREKIEKSNLEENDRKYLLSKLKEIKQGISQKKREEEKQRKKKFYEGRKKNIETKIKRIGDEIEKGDLGKASSLISRTYLLIRESPLSKTDREELWKKWNYVRSTVNKKRKKTGKKEEEKKREIIGELEKITYELILNNRLNENKRKLGEIEIQIRDSKLPKKYKEECISKLKEVKNIMKGHGETKQEKQKTKQEEDYFSMFDSFLEELYKINEKCEDFDLDQAVENLDHVCNIKRKIGEIKREINSEVLDKKIKQELYGKLDEKIKPYVTKLQMELEVVKKERLAEKAEEGHHLFKKKLEEQIKELLKKLCLHEQRFNL